MPVPILIMILLSVTLSALAQISLKAGMSAAHVSQALAGGSPLAIGTAILTEPYVLLGLFAYGASMAVWLFVLAKTDVSLAYPFVSIGFLITLALGVLLLGEHLSPLRIAGTMLVTLGVFLVARG
ncbi:MAG: SMR family transporter [Alphaproteobacteria bacterium]